MTDCAEIGRDVLLIISVPTAQDCKFDAGIVVVLKSVTHIISPYKLAAAIRI